MAMKLTITPLEEGHNFACLLCMQAAVKGSRIAHWQAVSHDVSQGQTTDRLCNTHLPEYVGRVRDFHHEMEAWRASAQRTESE